MLTSSRTQICQVVILFTRNFKKLAPELAQLGAIFSLRVNTICNIRNYIRNSILVNFCLFVNTLCISWGECRQMTKIHRWRGEININRKRVRKFMLRFCKIPRSCFLFRRG